MTNSTRAPFMPSERIKKRLACHVAALMVLAQWPAFASGPAPLADPAAETQTSCAHFRVVDYLDHDQTVTGLIELYRAEKFAELDRTLNCLIRSSERFQSGRIGASAVYWMFRRQLSSTGAGPADSSRVKKWLREEPQSIFAEFAQFRLRYSMAWNARGSSFASNVSDAGWVGFAHGLLEAEKGLLEASQELKNTPIWHNLLLAIASDTTGTRSSREAIFEEGVRRWPEYYDFYEVYVSRLVPKWGGSWGAVDQFISSWSVKRLSSEGDSMYARLYTNLVISGSDPSLLEIDWPRMRNSLDELVRRYPDSYHTNLAASWACGHNDEQYFQSSMGRIGEDELKPSAWLRGTSPDSCAEWLSEEAN